MNNVELPKKGDFYVGDEGQPVLIMEVLTHGPLGVLICLEPRERSRAIAGWGPANGKDFHLVKDHRGYWTKQQREGKCPILKKLGLLDL